MFAGALLLSLSLRERHHLECQCSLYLSNTIVGSSILGLSYAMAHTGVLFFL